MRKLREIFEDVNKRLSSKRVIGVIGMINVFYSFHYFTYVCLQKGEYSLVSSLIMWLTGMFCTLLGASVVLDKFKK